MPSSSALLPATSGSRDRLARLLTGLVVVTIGFLFFGIWQSQEETKIAYDVNRCGALRSECLYIYGALQQKDTPSNLTTIVGTTPAWADVLREMQQTRNDLRKRYPAPVRATDAAWNAFSLRVQERQQVDWETTNAFRVQADALTYQIESTVKQRVELAIIVYAFGIAALAFALPWGFVLLAELRESQKRLFLNSTEREATAHRFAAFFEGVPAACFGFDTAGKILIWNKAAESIFGHRSSDVLQKSLAEVLSVPEGNERVDEVVAQVLGGQEFHNLEWRHRLPDGRLRYLLSNVFPFRDGSLGITGGISATVDITERNEAEERLQSVLEGARCIFWDAIVEERPHHSTEANKYEWTYRLWNESAAQQIFPVRVENRDYVTAWLAARLPSDSEVSRIISTEAFEQGRPNYINEFRCRDRFGVMHWQREDVQIKVLGPGRWQLIGVCTDMTARKEAEGRLYSVLMGVRCIVWDAVVQEIPEPPYLDWKIQIWNEEAAQQVLPLERGAEGYVDVWIKSRLDDQPQLDKNSASALRWGLPGYTQEFRCRDRFGEVHWLQEDARIQPLERGSWRVIGVCTDVTAHKMAEERLQILTKELERSNASLQDFASIASHDLKEPLRKIHTFSGMLVRKETSLSDEGQGYLERIQASANRMQSLIDGLLSYSRVTTKGNAFAPTDLNEVIRGVLVDLEVRVQETKATITVCPLPTVMADSLQMRQLFQNLIGNALKFHREGEPCCIQITAQQEGNRHIITITDNGIGFAAKDAERIFEVFERLDGSGREGTGIGLAICRRIAERHGGTLTASGIPGVGATFTLTL